MSFVHDYFFFLRCTVQIHCICCFRFSVSGFEKKLGHSLLTFYSIFLASSYLATTKTYLHTYLLYVRTKAHDIGKLIYRFIEEFWRKLSLFLPICICVKFSWRYCPVFSKLRINFVFWISCWTNFQLLCKFMVCCCFFKKSFVYKLRAFSQGEGPGSAAASWGTPLLSQLIIERTLPGVLTRGRLTLIGFLSYIFEICSICSNVGDTKLKLYLIVWQLTT